MPIASTEKPPLSLTADDALDLGALALRSERGDGDTHVLAVHGELDVATVRGVERELRCIEARSVPTAIVIDLRALTFIDSTGLRMLVEAAIRAQTAVHRLVLRRPVDRVFRAFEICSIDKLLPFERDRRATPG